MKKIENVANVAVIVTCIFTISYVLLGGGHRNAPRTYKVGEKIVGSAGLGFRGATKTLIIFESSTCPYCNDSLDFYSRLSHEARPKGVRVVALTPEDVGINKAFLLAHGVQTDAVAALRNNRIKVSATPTLILVRADGTVLGSWLGKLPPEKEAAVLAQILG